jgi:hypothetical protein
MLPHKMNSFCFLLLMISIIMLGRTASLNILSAWRGSDAIKLARLIEAAPGSNGRYTDENIALEYELLDVFSRGSDFAWSVRSCVEDLSRSTLTIRLATLESFRGQRHLFSSPQPSHLTGKELPPSRAEEVSAPGDMRTEKPQLEVSDQEELNRRSISAQKAIGERLFCAPTDGNAWLQRSRIDFLAGDYSAAIIAARLSQVFAPAEKWVLQPRFELISQIFESGNEFPSREFLADLQRIVRYVPALEIASLYENAGPAVRGVLGREIHTLEARRKMQILSAVDHLGYTIPKTP